METDQSGVVRDDVQCMFRVVCVGQCPRVEYRIVTPSRRCDCDDVMMIQIAFRSRPFLMKRQRDPVCRVRVYGTVEV
jgi:hypothetical protein